MKVKKGVFSWCFYIFLHLFYSFTYKMSISLFFLIVVRWFFFIYFYQEWTTSFCLKCFGIVILVHYSHFSIKMWLVHLNIHIKSAFKDPPDTFSLPNLHAPHSYLYLSLFLVALKSPNQLKNFEFWLRKLASGSIIIYNAGTLYNNN